MPKKPSKKSKLKNKKSWLPKNRSHRIVLALIFVSIVAVAGIMALRNSFASSKGFAYYSQHDWRWANKSYPYVPGTRDQSDIKLKDSGCGPASLAMVATALRKTTNPYDIGQLYGPRYHYSTGTSQDIYPQFAKDFNLKHSSLGYFSNRNTRVLLQQQLQSKNTLVIIHAKEGLFTGSGHILVMREYSPSKGAYLLADPNNSKNQWIGAGKLLDKGNLQAAHSFRRL